MPNIVKLIYFWSRPLLGKINFLTSYLKCSELLKNNQKKKARLLCVPLLFTNLFSNVLYKSANHEEVQSPKFH